MANPASRASLEPLALCAVLSAAGALGAWPATGLGPDPVAALAWVALLAPAAGLLGAARGLGLLPFGWLVPALWTVPVAWSSSSAAHALPSLLWPAAAWTGLFALGAALGELVRRQGASAWGAAGAALLLSGTLAVAPARGALTRAPWPPRVASLLLDVAPDTLVIESAGVDWMRHAATYDPVGTDRFERRAWNGSLAGSALFLVGCLCAAGARLLPARSRSPARPDPR